VLLLLALPLLLFRLDAKDFWDASEARPPESAREMQQQDDYLVQYTNGEVDLTKPPVQCWLVGLAFRLTGAESQWAARLPTVLAALALVLLAFVLARRVAGPRAGFLAGVLLLTQVRFLWQARLAELEVLLALGVTLAWLALDRALEAPGGRRTRAWLLFHLAWGFAFLVKGPVALLLVLPGAAACAIWRRRGRRLVSAPALATLPAGVAVALGWYLAVVLRDRSTLDTFLAYARGDNVGHLRGLGYYLWNYPLNAFPAIVFVLAGLALPFSSLLEPAARERAKLPFAGFVAGFVLLSLLHAKQTHYLIPLFPLGAVLAGVWLDAAARRAPRPAATAWCATAAVVVFLALALAAAPWWLGPHLPDLPGPGWTLPLGLLAAALAGAAAWRSWTAGGPRHGAALLGALVLLELFALGYGAPACNRPFSARRFLHAVAARVPADAPLASTIFRSHSDHLWYLGRTVRETDVAGARRVLAAPSAAYALVHESELPDLGDGAHVLLRDPSFQKKRRDVALVANAAGAESR
jgi:4-amino-4-deoxy-L-arabinose transferase-like glycosyltransferase